MKKDRFSLLFFKKSKLLKSGEASIGMRISANGTRVDVTINKSIEPHLWNQAKERAKGTSKKALDLNEYIDDAVQAIPRNAAGRIHRYCPRAL